MFHQTALGTANYADQADLIDQLLLGIEDCRAVFITYQSLRATEPVTYDLYPHGLVYHRGAVVSRGPQAAGGGDAPLEGQPHRGRRGHRGALPAAGGFRPARHLLGSFGVYHGDGDVCVKIRFSPAVARYVAESRWHESQKLAPQKDGSLLAEFRLSSTTEIKRWILSFGRHALVLEPGQLADELRDEAAAICGGYPVDAVRGSRQNSPSGN